MSDTILTRGTLPETLGLDRPHELVLGGLPLAAGQLREAGDFDLALPSGVSTVSGSPAAWWPDGSIKWLHLVGPVSLKGGEANDFTLSRAATPRTGALVVTKLPGITEISGGPLTVRLSPDSHRLLQVRDRAGRQLTRGPGLSASLRASADDGRPRPTVAWTFDQAGISVVSATPARVVLRLANRFVEDGRTLAELVTFVEVLRDSPRLGLQPVLIYLGEPERDRLASLKLTVHTVFGGDRAQFGFGQDRGPGYWDQTQWLADAHRWPEARLVQAGSSFYRLDKRTGPAGSWLKIREGQRAQGWAHLGDPQGGLTGALRYCWQEYPRTLAVDCEAGTLSFGLIPEEAEALDLRRYSPVILGNTIYEYGEGPFNESFHGPYGIAKASELMVYFHGAGYEREEAARAGLAWTAPVRFTPDPVALAASGVVGGLAAQAPAAYAAKDAELVDLADFLFDEREQRGWYGLLDYGDMGESYYGERDQWAFDDGGYGWVNTESLPDLGLWLMALRHARPDWLEGAIAMSRHNRDVDMYHRGNFKGVGSRHNVNHWGCKDKEWRVSQPLVKRLHYYLTGDPWTREVILETVAVYQSYTRTSALAPSMVSAVAGLMVKHELTGSAKDGEVLAKVLDVYAQGVLPDGHFAKQVELNLATGEGRVILDGKNLMGTYFFLQGFGGQHILTELAATYQHAGLSEALVRHARMVATAKFDMTVWMGHQVPSKSGAMAFLAFAWRQTGESLFREALAEALSKDSTGYLERSERGGDGPLDWPRFTAMNRLTRKNKITCGIGILMHQWPYAFAALAEAKG